MYIIKKDMTNENKNSLKYGVNESDAELFGKKSSPLKKMMAEGGDA